MKVAVITHYYNSKNYGGNLQAYAMCKVLNDLGLEAEQLSYDKYPRGAWRKIRINSIVRFVLHCIDRLKSRRIASSLEVRNNSIRFFNQKYIPHTEEVYDRNTIATCVDHYDAFVTGSDQVWHPIAYCPAYGLEFVPSSKIKLSYAASIAVEAVTEEYRCVLENALRDFKGISVREDRAAAILRDFVNQSVCVSLDPTLLLSSREWDLVSSGYRYGEAYMLCYFLGNSIQCRRLAEEYAKGKNLKIVTLPHLLGTYRECDQSFGDDKLYDISPADFISLINGADIIFTDSFHATVFSIIYNKEFVVFDRSITQSMGSRISSLLKMTHLEDRFCGTAERMTISYLNSMKRPCFEKANLVIKEHKAESIAYLKSCLLESNDERKHESN